MKQTIKAASNASVSMVNGKLVITVEPGGVVEVALEDKGVKLEVEVRGK